VWYAALSTEDDAAVAIAENDYGRPLTRAELEPLLRERGVIPAKCSRAYAGNAVSEFSDDIVYLNGVGYWLKDRPWPAAGYRPRVRNRAA
jgi:hypothetical protein